MKSFKYRDLIWYVEDGIIHTPCEGIDLYVDVENGRLRKSNRELRGLWNDYLFVQLGRPRYYSHILLACYYETMRRDDDSSFQFKQTDVVHHIDMDKHNDKQSNLVILSRSGHNWLHRALELNPDACMNELLDIALTKK